MTQTSDIIFDSSLAEKYPLTILLAEDNIVSQKITCFLLNELGYEADIATNGQDVLDKIQKDKYDLILMDIEMPRMNGFDTTHTIRQLDLDSQPYIIAMTAHNTKTHRHKCQQSGMNDFMLKPLDIPDFLTALKTCFDQVCF
ncbi:MAG TPA: response regulator [Anaerolineae bacterium]|nr:response regulator [Anaerolineae bacterium]